MSKTKNKNHSEIEGIRGYVRELEKEVRSLRQQLRQYEKYDRSQELNKSVDSEDTKVELRMTKDCEECGKGKMIETLDLGTRGIFGECNCCGFKGRMR